MQICLSKTKYKAQFRVDFCWGTCYLSLCLNAPAGQMLSTLLCMMVLDWLKCYGVTSIYPTPLPSPCMEGRSTGLTGGRTLWPRQTNGRDTTSPLSSAPTRSPLTCRFITHPDSHRVGCTADMSALTLINREIFKIYPSVPPYLTDLGFT